MRKNRGKLRFTDELKNPVSLDKTPVHQTDKPKKSKQRHKYRVENTGAKADVAAGASPAVMAQSANNSSHDIPSVRAVEQGQNAMPFDLDLLAESAQTIYAETPDETDTPDSNVGVSAVEATIGTAAGFIGHMAAGGAKPKSKKQSKLKYDRQKLHYTDDERNSGDNAAAQDDTSNPGNPDNMSANTKRPDNSTQSSKDLQSRNAQNSNSANQSSNNEDTPISSDIKADGGDSDGANAENSPRPAFADSAEDTTSTSLADSANSTVDPTPADGKPKSKLQFSKEDKQISKPERKQKKYDKKLEKAKEKLPSRTVIKKERVYNEKDDKAASKQTFEKKAIPVAGAKRNEPKPENPNDKTNDTGTRSEEKLMQDNQAAGTQNSNPPVHSNNQLNINKETSPNTDTKASDRDSGGNIASNGNNTVNIADDTTRPPPADSLRSIFDNDTASETVSPAAGKQNNKFQFTKEEVKTSKLEEKTDKYRIKPDKTKDKAPSKAPENKERLYDEKKNKAASKLSFEKEIIPINEAKWNNPKPVSLPQKAAGAGTSMAVTKIHAKIHQVEHENVGIKAAHNAELVGESAYRGTKRTVKSAYRFHKNRPYRKVAKLEQKSIKNKMKLDYKKALRDNPKLKSNPLSRFLMKQKTKRQYAAALRSANNTAKMAKGVFGITAKAGKIITAIIRKNPVFLIKAGILALILFLFMSLFTMCMAMFSGGSALIGAVTYPAEYEDISDASVLMTELETDLRIYILEIEANRPGFDEYRLDIGSIGHDPFELMAFLSALYHDFSFSEVEATIRAVFDAMYTLEFDEVTEIREREEEQIGTGIGYWIDSDGNIFFYTYNYTYTIIVQYEWRILYVTLTSVPMSEVIADMMNDEQTSHFNVLMYSRGARQIVGNPFDFNWKPYMTSPFGYRVHPIQGGKSFHWGIDIGLPTGTPIRAGFDGVVVYVGYHPTGYGNIVIIENENGIQARYAHCHQIFVTVGQEVERGEVIASVGTTGASTGPHLHLEISVNGRRVNPIYFLEFSV